MSDTSSDEEESRALILDIGSCYSKIGKSGEMKPMIIPTVVGYSKDMKSKECGTAAVEGREELDLKYPVVKGNVVDWDILKDFLDHVFGLLKANPAEIPIALVDSPCSSMRNRNGWMKLLTGTFNCPAVGFIKPHAATLTANSYTTGLVVDIGHSTASISGLYSGFPIKQADKRLMFFGESMDILLQKLLSKQQEIKDLIAVRGVKETHCYVALDPDEEAKNVEKVDFKLTDGKNVSMGVERFKTVDGVFDPSLYGSNSEGLHEILKKTILTCPLDIRKDFFMTIILIGGSTMFKGFEERLTKELDEITSEKIKVKVIAGKDRHCVAWIGASILGSMARGVAWISRELYKEQGSKIVRKYTT